MISRKKRQRYKASAAQRADELGIKINLDDWEEVWELLEKTGEPSYVYAIGEVGGKEVKIGRSVNPGQRLRSLQTSSPVRYTLWGFCPEKSPLTEKELHQRLKDFRIGGEWFLTSPEVRAAVEEIRSR